MENLLSYPTSIGGVGQIYKNAKNYMICADVHRKMMYLIFTPIGVGVKGMGIRIQNNGFELHEMCIFAQKKSCF